MRPAFLLLLALLAAAADPAPRLRPATWAQPVINTGLDNWHQVDALVHRSAQPGRGGMRQAEAFGIRTVLSLRAHHDDVDEARGTGLRLERIPADAGDLSYAQLVAAVRLVRAATATGPVLIHCWHGSDRTGAVVAAWRIAAQRWSPEQALDEMVHGGYGHHEYYGNLRRLIGAIDPARLRADAGFPP